VEATPNRLLRVVRASDGTLIPDWNRKLGGRGAHVCMTHRCVADALKHQAFERALKNEIRYPALADFMLLLTGHLERTLSSYLGAALKKGCIVPGTDASIAAIAAHSIRFLLITPDSSGAVDFQGRAMQAGIPWHFFGDQIRVGEWLNRRPTGVVGVTDGQLAEAMVKLFQQWDALKPECPN
jgi:predicted RNA-binding protein YlxR (DUF448 family)